jgi:uncharacterized protein (DUF3084 family)
MNIGQRDAIINQMEKQIKDKDNILLDNKKNIGDLAKSNSYIKDVKNDYNKYYDYIIQDKYKQINALQKIQEYLSSLNIDLNQTMDKGNQHKYHEDKILKEIEEIKRQIDTING